jgi:hypothetical protein
MTFVQRFGKPTIVLRDAIAVVESGEPFVVAAGNASSHGVVVKSRADGSTAWAFAIKINGAEVDLRGVAQLKGDKSSRYVVGGRAQTKLCLICVDASGAELWNREFDVASTEESLRLAPDPIGSGVYLSYADRDGSKKVLNSRIIRIDGDGHVLAQREFLLGDHSYTNGEVVITALETRGVGLTVTGRIGPEPAGFKASLSADLSKGEAEVYPGLPVHGLTTDGDDRQDLLAYDLSRDSWVWVQQDEKGVRQRVIASNEEAAHASLLRTGAGLLVSLVGASRGAVYLLRDDGKVLWSKDTGIKDAVGNAGALKVGTLSYQPETDQVAFLTTDPSVLGLQSTELKAFPQVASELPGSPFEEVASNVMPVRLIDLGLSSELVAGVRFPIDPGRFPVFEPLPAEATADLEISGDMLLQSPHIYVQAAGSEGDDSTKGIHLRWTLKRGLVDHLPKADYALTTANFSKPDDYVRIYRAPYTRHARTVAVSKKADAIHPYEWIYVVDNQLFALHFLDQARYDQVRASISPDESQNAFLTAYGDGLMELEAKRGLGFAVRLQFRPQDTSNSIDLELRSVEEDRFTAARVVSLRQRYTVDKLNEQRLFSENIRSIRFRASQALLLEVEWEFYLDFLQFTVKRKDWTFLGKHALTKDSAVAFQRLEPSAGDVHGAWLRYNDDAYVNVQNYKDKWGSSSLPAENRIEEVVADYIDLSNDPANPRAVTAIYYNDPNAVPPPGQEPEDDFDPTENQFGLSNLYLLQTAAMDYHIARMLGLGVFDLSPQIAQGKFIYAAEYFTNGDLGDGGGSRPVQHVYLSLPTSLADHRLPLPVDLKEPVPGVFHGLDTDAPEVLTDPDGYAPDGRVRFLSLFHELLPEEPENAPFFFSNYLFASADLTLPVYAGIEYRAAGSPGWVKPELPFDDAWLNIDATVPDARKQETRPVVIPEPIYPVFVHREHESGVHEYGSYGINWFSRARPSPAVWSIETTIRASNLLQPPSSVNAFLVVPEEPLQLTSAAEQAALSSINATDKTLVRLTWEYDHAQELIEYHRKTNGQVVDGYAELPDADEPFADQVEIFFRASAPNSVGGKIIAVTNAPDPIMSVVTTGPYVFQSMGTDPVTGDPVEQLVPELPAPLEPNFIGGLVTVNGINHPIHAIDNSGAHPRFTVFKVDADGNAAVPGSNVPVSELSAPPVDGLFTALENLAVRASWGTTNPFSFKVNVEPTTIHREEVRVRQPDGTVETHVHKFRGIYRDALIEAVLEDTDGNSATPEVHNGMYKITFNVFTMPQHTQAGGSGHSVEFRNGVVRIHTTNAPDGPRKDLSVVHSENIGGPGNLILFVADSLFDPSDPSFDPIPLGVHRVNYYPGYRAYLRADQTHGLTAANTLPSGDEQVRYTIFGLRSHDTALGYFSGMSIPGLMFAQAITEPQQPRQPTGGSYATRPDFYGKASYTFSTEFEHEPYSTQYLRASDIQILRALYTTEDGGNPAVWTVQRIQAEIFAGGADEWFNDRWRNLVGLSYTYTDPAGNGLFEELGGVSLPLPNNPRFIEAINAFIDGHNEFYGVSVPHLSTITSLHQVVIPGSADNAELQVKDFLRQTIKNCFVPLTEIPIIYRQIKGSDYQPMSKKQVVRDRNGVLLSPSHPDFDNAPMAKRIGPDASATPPKMLHETQFTDFGLDGASNAHYFYAVREFNLKMKAGSFSPVQGPVHMVNTAPPRQPEIVKVTAVLEQRELDIAPAIELRVNGYGPEQHIRSLQVYRATNGIDAQTVRTMQKLPEVDVVSTGMESEPVWVIRDDFSDLDGVPYGDPLFYRLTVSRIVAYADRNGTIEDHLVPSEPSRPVLTNIVETYNPEAPKLEYYSTALNGSGMLDQVTLAWDKQVHNGKYEVFRKNERGNWTRIHTVQDNSPRLLLPLADTSLGSGSLQVVDSEGNRIYHHFKVAAINFAGMSSRVEEILTIHQPRLWNDISVL